MSAVTANNDRTRGGARATAGAPAQRTSSPASRRQRLLRLQEPIPRRLYLALAVIGFLLPLALWEFLSRSGLVTPLFLPTPVAVLAQAWTWAHGELAVDIGISIYRVTAGFLIAACIGVPFGVLIGSFKMIEGLFQPLNDYLRYMPAAAFIPLMILWVGIGEASKIAIIFVGVFFQIIVMTADVVRRVPKAYLEAAYTMGAGTGETLRMVVWRGALPPLIDVLRVNMGFAWTYLVVAELVAANKGLGYAILQAQRFMNTGTIFAGILIIGCIGLLFDLSFRYLHRWLFPWLHQ